MKFIVDAHLPKSISDFLNNKGHDSIHTIELENQNETSDKKISEISVNEERVVISKDTDFFHSYLVKKVPYKLLLIKTGNISTPELKKLFEKNLLNFINKLEKIDLVELKRDT